MRRKINTNHAHNGKMVVPEDIERAETHEPCFYCGIARGPCRHRRPW